MEALEKDQSTGQGESHWGGFCLSRSRNEVRQEEGHDEEEIPQILRNLVNPYGNSSISEECSSILVNKIMELRLENWFPFVSSDCSQVLDGGGEEWVDRRAADRVQTKSLNWGSHSKAKNQDIQSKHKAKSNEKKWIDCQTQECVHNHPVEYLNY